MLLPASLLVISTLTHGVFGQTTTDCNPTEKTCPSDTALDSSTYSHDFTTGADDDNWTMTASGVNYTSSGAEFTISKQGDNPTIKSNWYIFFGSVSFYMRIAPGTGIVSSAILQSDDLDEIDWEWLGGETSEVQTNYFSKGSTATSDRAATLSVPSGNAETTLHNYTMNWTEESMQWIIDGSVVRTVTYAAVNSGYGYPQTPMTVRIGIWAGGDPDNAEGTIEWAGGETDYTKGPFTMVLEKVEVINYSPAKSYKYGDKTGDYGSIVVSDSDSSSSSSSSAKSSSATKTASASASMTTSVSAAATASASGAAAEADKDGESTNSTSAAASATTSSIAQSSDAEAQRLRWGYATLLGALAVGLAL